MNFQAVAASNGNLEAMFAIVTEVGNQKLNRNQKPIQTVKLKDDNGEQHSVTINKGNGELLDGSVLGQRLSFNLSTYQGQRGLGYSGFWNNRAQVNQPTPQKPQQDPSRAPESSKPAKGIAEGDVRHGVIYAAIQSGQVEVKTITDAEYWKGYIMTGRAPLPPSKIPDPHPDIQEERARDETDTPYY